MRHPEDNFGIYLKQSTELTEPSANKSFYKEKYFIIFHITFTVVLRIPKMKKKDSCHLLTNCLFVCFSYVQ